MVALPNFFADDPILVANWGGPRCRRPADPMPSSTLGEALAVLRWIA